MEKVSFVKRFIVPLAIVVGIMVISSVIYHMAGGRMSPGSARDTLIGIFGPLLFVSIWFFALVGPPIGYFMGATFFERFVIAFANPVIWVTRMESMVACQFSPVEMVYFFFLPWFFGIICVTLFLFSISELVCRSIGKIGGDKKVRIFSPVVLLFLVGGLLGTYVGLIRGQEWVYMIVHHYAAHFLN
jgi:hypothetical protein